MRPVDKIRKKNTECALENHPGVYTDVALYNSWIDEKIYWAGDNEDISTPTTVSTSTSAVPNQGTAVVLSFSLISFCLLILTVALPHDRVMKGI